MRSIKKISLALALALAAMSMTAAAASAAPGDVVWSHEKSTWSGTLTFKRNGGNASTCTFSSAQGRGEPNVFYAFLPWSVKCSGGGVVTWLPAGSVTWSAESGFTFTLYDELSGSGLHESPWSNRTWASEAEFAVPFTNASGGTPSRLTFSNTVVAKTNFGETVTASGELVPKNGTSNVTLKVE